MFEFLVPRIPKGVMFENLFVVHPDRFTMQLATILDTFLPSLKAVFFCLRGIEREVVQHVLRSLVKNTSLSRVSLHLPNEPGDYSQTLADCLKENRCLISLTLYHDERNEKRSDSYINAITNGFRRNTTIQNLTLGGFNADVGAFAALLGVPPKRVLLHNCQVLPTEDTSTIHRRGDASTSSDGGYCRMEELKVASTAIPRLGNFLQKLVKLSSSLNRLDVSLPENSADPPDDDAKQVASVLISILEQTKITHLRFMNYPLDDELFCKHLETNETLVSFEFNAWNVSIVPPLADMLRNHNMTIQQLSYHGCQDRPWPLSQEYPRACKEIVHYTTLNRLGRKQAHSLTLTPGEMTTLLSSAMEKSPRQTMTVFFLYELLRESLSTWCDNAANKADATTANVNKPSAANHQGTKRKRNGDEE